MLHVIPRSPGRGRDKLRDEESLCLLATMQEGFLASLGGCDFFVRFR